MTDLLHQMHRDIEFVGDLLENVRDIRTRNTSARQNN